MHPFALGLEPGTLVGFVDRLEVWRWSDRTDLSERRSTKRLRFCLDRVGILRGWRHAVAFGAVDLVRPDVVAEAGCTMAQVVRDPHEPRFMRGPRWRRSVAVLVARNGFGDPDRFGADVIVVVRSWSKQRRPFQDVGQFM